VFVVGCGGCGGGVGLGWGGGGAGSSGNAGREYRALKLEELKESPDAPPGERRGKQRNGYKGKNDSHIFQGGWRMRKGLLGNRLEPLGERGGECGGDILMTKSKIMRDFCSGNKNPCHCSLAAIRKRKAFGEKGAGSRRGKANA